jgi:hypothetical protein
MKTANIIFSILWVLCGLFLILYTAFVEEIDIVRDIMFRVIGIFFIGCVIYNNIKQDE